jgi:hypothetical protein
MMGTMHLLLCLYCYVSTQSKRRDSQHGSTAASSAQPAFTTTGAALATQSAQVLAATAADAEKARRRKSYSTDVRESSIGLL